MAHQKLPEVLKSEDGSSMYSDDDETAPLLGHSSYPEPGNGQSGVGQPLKPRPFDWCSCIGCVTSFVAIILVATAVAIPVVYFELSSRKAAEAVLSWHQKETMKVDDVDPVIFTGFQLRYKSKYTEYVASGFLFDQCPPLVPERFVFEAKNKPVSNTEAYIVYFYLRRGSQVNVTFCTFFSSHYYMYVLKGDENYERWLSFAELNYVQQWKSNEICRINSAYLQHTFDVNDDDFYFFLLILDYYSIPELATAFANYSVLSMQYNTSALVPKKHCMVNATSRECAIDVPSGIAYGDCAVIAVDSSNASKSYHYDDVYITYVRTLNVWLVVVISVLGVGLVVVMSVCMIICCVRLCRRKLASRRKAAHDLPIQ